MLIHEKLVGKLSILLGKLAFQSPPAPKFLVRIHVLREGALLQWIHSSQAVYADKMKTTNQAKFSHADIFS